MSAEQKIETLKLKPAEIEKKVVELANAGNPPEKIGLILRDMHGVPKVKLFGKKIGKILKENNLKINSEENITIKKMDNLGAHTKKHKHDYSAKRAITKHSSKLRKIRAYQNKRQS